MVNGQDFQAANVTLKRSVNAGYNTMCLPFWVSKDDMKAASIATYKEIVDKEDNNSVVTFEKADHIEANVPFVANYNEAVHPSSPSPTRVWSTQTMALAQHS